MSDEQVQTEDTTDDAAIETEVSTLLGAEVSKDLQIKNALIAAKKELRASNRRVKELEPVAARVSELDEKLNAAAPIIEAVARDPRLRAEALRVVQGKPTSMRVEQPDVDDDPDAADVAETMGLYLADGTTPDLVKARKLMGVFDKRNGRQTDERMRPLAGAVLGSRAERTIADARQQTTRDGDPIATPESIEEAVKMLGGQSAPLLAGPNATNVLLTIAAGLDRTNGRTPKAVEEPLYMERQSGRRRAEALIDPVLAKALEATGVKAADGEKILQKHSTGGR